jgi:hypothetical protein
MQVPAITTMTRPITGKAHDGSTAHS